MQMRNQDPSYAVRFSLRARVILSGLPQRARVRIGQHLLALTELVGLIPESLEGNARLYSTGDGYAITYEVDEAERSVLVTGVDLDHTPANMFAAAASA